MNKTVAIIIAVAVLLCAGVAAGAVWWVQQNPSSAAASAPRIDANQYSYVTLDKIVVMLRTDAETPRAQNYYMSMDLVFRSDKNHAKSVKSDLPMLKGVAVRTLSKIDVGQAKVMSVEEWTALLSSEVMNAYAGREPMRGFDQVLVSRLIIE